MTREELLRLANLVGITGPGSPKQHYRMFCNPDKLEKLAWLIASHERDACIWLCEMIGNEKGKKAALECAEAIRKRK